MSLVIILQSKTSRTLLVLSSSEMTLTIPGGNILKVEL
jgi:hypothetical protein